MSRALIRRLLFAAGRVPRYVTVGERDPQQRIRVILDGLDTPRDVTWNHVVASLRPLTIALALPAPERRTLSLRFSQRSEPDRLLGRLRIDHDATIIVDDTPLQLFRVTQHTNACLPWGVATVFELWRAWAERTRDPQANFQMTSPDLRALQVVYTCPRPVVLVSVRHGRASNLFPMDLVGPTDGPYFLLALRNTSPSVALMTESRRVALADVPFEDAALARQLGAHHMKTHIDWEALPFETDPSPAHGLRVPRAALRTRDVEVRETRVVGSHTLFVTRVVHESRLRQGPQMAGLSGSYYWYLRVRGIRLPLAP